MPTAASLEGIRRSAFRATYQDGLIELVAGALFFIVALATGRPAFYWTYLVAILLLGPGHERLKARFTYPRIGYARLPDEEPKRFGRAVLLWVSAVVLLAAVGLFATGNLTDNLAWRRLAPAIAGLLTSAGFLYLGQRSGYTRHYALAAASVLLGLLMTVPVMAEPYEAVRVWALLMALTSLAVGALVLRRFLRDHPIIEERQPDGQ